MLMPFTKIGKKEALQRGRWVQFGHTEFWSLWDIQVEMSRVLDMWAWNSKYRLSSHWQIHDNESHGYGWDNSGTMCREWMRSLRREEDLGGRARSWSIFLSVTWSGHYFSLQFPDHLIPHATLPPTLWPHAGLVTLWTVPYQNLSCQWPTLLPPSRALTRTLSALYTQNDASPLTPIPSFFQSINCLVDPWTILSPTPPFPVR